MEWGDHVDPVYGWLCDAYAIRCVKPRSVCVDARLADVDRLFDPAAIECELDGAGGDNTERDAAGNDESPAVLPG